jgi:hypothetical protein
MVGLQRINDMSSTFQNEMKKYYPGYYLGTGISKVGGNLKKAVGPKQKDDPDDDRKRSMK